MSPDSTKSEVTHLEEYYLSRAKGEGFYLPFLDPRSTIAALVRRGLLIAKTDSSSGRIKVSAAEFVEIKLDQNIWHPLEWINRLDTVERCRYVPRTHPFRIPGRLSQPS